MILGVFGDIWEEISIGFYYIFLIIDGSIYSLLNSIYKIYIALASARLLTSGMFTEIANRFYAIIGVGMLFVMSYVIIQGIVNPDNFAKSGGEGGQLLKRIGIAVLGLALVPGAFRIAYTGQDIILSQNLIGKIFLGYDDENNIIKHGPVSIDDEQIQFDSDGDGKADSGQINQNDAVNTSAGTVAAMSMWQAVFYPTNIDSEKDMDDAANEIKTELSGSEFVRGVGKVTKVACGVAIAVSIFTLGAGLLAAAALCGAAVATDAVEKLTGKEYSLKQAYGAAAGSGDFTVFAGFAGKVAHGDITYKIFFSTAIGVAGCYLFFSFAIDMAVRAVKLVYMQIISPIPLMLQILPKFKDNFNKWLKTVLSLFMEVFIRLTFVYVVAYLISHLMTIMNGGWLARANLGLAEKFFARIVLIIGMLIFAKTAPQFISETLGISSGNMSLGIRKKLAEGGVLSVAAAAGGIGANFLAGGASNAINKWKQNFNNNDKSQGFKKGRNHVTAGISLVTGALTGSFGLAARSSRKAILDAKNVSNFKDVRDRVKDTYHRGKEDQAEMQRKQDELESKIESRGYDPEKDNYFKKIGYIVGDKARDFGNFMKNDFASTPYNATKYEPQIAIEQVLDAMKDAGTEAALNVNKNYQKALNDLAELDTEDGRKDQARKLAEEMAANGKMTNSQLEQIKKSPQALEQFMLDNRDALNDRIFDEKMARKKKVETAKKNALDEELSREAISGPGDVSKAISKVIKDPKNAEALKKYAKTRIADQDGNMVTVEDFMKSRFGDNYETEVTPSTGAFADRLKNSDTDISVRTTNGRGTIRIRGGKATYYENGQLVGNVNLDTIGSDQMQITDSAGNVIRNVSGYEIDQVQSLGGNTVNIGENQQLQNGSVQTVAQAFGGTIEFASSDGTTVSNERVIVSQDAAGNTVGTVISSTAEIPATISLADLGSSGITIDAPIQATVGTSGSKLELSLTGSGSDLKVDLGDGVPIQLDASSGGINLANIALDSSVPISAVVGGMSLREGTQMVTVNDKPIEVTVSGGTVTGCVEKVTGDLATIQADVGTAPKIDVVGTADSLAAGESVTVKGVNGRSMTISKGSDGKKTYKVSKVDQSTGVPIIGEFDEIMEADAQSFADRTSVDLDGIAQLTAADRETRLKVINGEGQSKEVRIGKGSDGTTSYTVTREVSGGVKVSDAISKLGSGQSMSFSLRGNQGTVTATNTDGNVTYTVTRDGVSSAPMSQDEFRSSYEVSVDTSTVAGMVKSGSQTIGDVTITSLNSDQLREYDSGRKIVGGSGIVRTMASEGKEGTIEFDNKVRVRVEKTDDSVRYVCNEGGETHIYTSESELVANYPELFGPDAKTSVDNITLLDQGSRIGIGSDIGKITKAMKEAREADKEYMDAKQRERGKSDSSSDKK